MPCYCARYSVPQTLILLLFAQASTPTAFLCIIPCNIWDFRNLRVVMSCTTQDTRSHGCSSHPSAALQLVQQFQGLYACTPFAVAKAPGRVNLIGEHIDYEGYGVMPMAISHACSVAIAWEPDGVGPACAAAAVMAGGVKQLQQHPQVLRIANMQQGLYPRGELVLDAVDQSQGMYPSWCKYIHAAYRGVVEFAASKEQQVPQTRNILLLVHGTVPPGAGLSSSSALVVSSAMALLALWCIEACPAEVAELTCRCERFVGTQGGGMDQAVACMAQQGVAMHVNFNPVRASPVPLPAGATFVVANCLAPSHKAETASTRFNLRVLECQLAAMLLAKLVASTSAESSDSNNNDSRGGGGGGSICKSNSIIRRRSSIDWRQVKILKDVEPGLLSFASSTGNTAGAAGRLQSYASDAAVVDSSQLTWAVEQLLPQSSYQLQQVADLLGTSISELTSLLPPALQTAAAISNVQLQLQQRAKHVFSESQRVLQFRQLCLQSDVTESEKMAQLGALMDGSHCSCAELYQCSCEELDTLVGVAKTAGALGARLTGAGWGGCMVAMVATADVGHFMQQLQRHFYQPAAAAGRLETLDQVEQHLFTTEPAAGASVVVLKHALSGHCIAG